MPQRHPRSSSLSVCVKTGLRSCQDGWYRPLWALEVCELDTSFVMHLKMAFNLKFLDHHTEQRLICVLDVYYCKYWSRYFELSWTKCFRCLSESHRLQFNKLIFIFFLLHLADLIFPLLQMTDTRSTFICMHDVSVCIFGTKTAFFALKKNPHPGFSGSVLLM